MGGMARHGDGGVTKRKDGRLQVAITLTSGRRIYRTIPRLSDPKRQRELAERARRELVTMREAELDPGGQTLEAFLRSWLRDMASATHARIRPNTLAAYTVIAEKHLIPVLGEHRLERLRESHVQAWLDGLAISAQYVSHCRAFLRRVLNVAVRQRVIARNPAVGVELPRIPKYKASPMAQAEIRTLLEATTDDRLGALWRVAAITGLRSGELAGLSWDDVDLERGVITVTARLARQNGEWVRVALKADRPLERMAIDRRTAELLDAHRIRQAAERTADWPYWGLVFTTAAGYPLDRWRLRDEFHRACDLAGITRRRPHDIRHTNNSLMRDVGVAKDVRKARQGHSTDEMDDRYGLPSEIQDRDAAERLSEAIR
jgi:integrase